MKHAKKTAIATILVLLIALVPLFAEDQQQQRRRQDQRRQGKPQGQMQGGPQGGMPARMPGGQMRQMPISRMLNALKLTDEQKKQAKVITDNSQKTAELTHKQVAQATKSLRDAVAKEASDEKIRECALAIGKAMGDRAVGQVKTVKDIKAILTEEQAKKFGEMQKRMKERMQQGTGRGQGSQEPTNNNRNNNRQRPQRRRPEKNQR